VIAAGGTGKTALADTLFRQHPGQTTFLRLRLYLADYHLKMGNLEGVERLIHETGYHRRDRELAELKAKRAAR
jgi:hypothetical protein